LLGTRKGLHRAIAVITRDDPCKKCSRAANPSAGRTASFRRSWAGPPRKRLRETATHFKSTPPKIAGKPLSLKYFYAVRSESSGQ
jgi:hypothetical protein